MASSYIYIIEAPNGDCYIGQSIDTKSSSLIGYDRIYQHMRAAYGLSSSGNDESVILFKNWPVKNLWIKVYRENDPVGPYGISESVYKKFLEYFDYAEDTNSVNAKKRFKMGTDKKTGKRKKTKELDEDTKVQMLREGQIVIKVKNEEGTEEDKTYELARKYYIDIAEIIWMCRYQIDGKHILNKVMGGQATKWAFYQDKSRQSQPVFLSRNTATPAMLTSLLLSTELASSQQQSFNNFQSDLDKACEDFLDKEMANLFYEQFKKGDRKKIGNILKNDTIAPALKKAISNAIFTVLNNKGQMANQHTAGFITAINNVIQNYSNAGLQSLGFSVKTKGDVKTSILENIASKLAASLLEWNQNAKIRRGRWLDLSSLKFKFDGEHIAYKINPDPNNVSHISVSLNQSIAFLNADRSFIASRWWYASNKASSGKIVSFNYRWHWAKLIFKGHFEKIKRPLLGIKVRASEGLIIGDGPVEINGRMIADVSPTEDSLSGRMRLKYRFILGYKNDIFNHWNDYFGSLYADITTQEWLNDGDDFYILKDPVELDGEVVFPGFHDDPEKEKFYIGKAKYEEIIF